MKKSIFGWAVSVLTVVFLFSSCDSDNDSAGSSEVPAFLLVANASPDAGNLFFFSDSDALNHQGLSFGYANGYYALNHGSSVLTVKNTNGTVLATKNLQLASAQVSSAFAVNNLSQLELQVYTDSLVTPTYGKARVRFINLAVDLPTLKVVPSQGGEPFYIDYKEAGQFFDVTPGTNFILTPDPQEGPAIQVNTSAFNAGNIYTVYTKGLINAPEGNPNRFSYNVLRNY